MATAVEPKAFTPADLTSAAKDDQKAAVKKIVEHHAGGDSVELNYSKGDVNHIMSAFQTVADEKREAGKTFGTESAPKEDKRSIWPWATAAGLTGAAATALIVWAIMHNHDKKLMAKIAAANSQGN